MITFDTPESVMSCDILSYMEVALLMAYMKRPFPLIRLLKAVRANPMHGSALCEVETWPAARLSCIHYLTSEILNALWRTF